MGNCKDCIHAEVCVDWSIAGYEQAQKPITFEKYCDKNFKHINNFVEFPYKIGDVVYEVEVDCKREECEFWHEQADFYDYDHCTLDIDDERKCGKFRVRSFIITNLRVMVDNLHNVGWTIFCTEEEAISMLNQINGDDNV